MKRDFFNSFEKTDVVISEDLELDTEDQCLSAEMETYFDVDKKFGINTRDDENTWVNMYCWYNPILDNLRVIYCIDTQNKDFIREYMPTDEEKQMLSEVMEAACQKQNNQSCKDFYIREYLENYNKSIDFVCEKNGELYQVKNPDDNFILCSGTDDKMAQYVGRPILIGMYDGGKRYTIECSDTGELIDGTGLEGSEEPDEDMEI